MSASTRLEARASADSNKMRRCLGIKIIVGAPMDSSCCKSLPALLLPSAAGGDVEKASCLAGPRLRATDVDQGCGTTLRAVVP